MRGATWLVEELLASEEDLCSVELVIVVMGVAHKNLLYLVLQGWQPPHHQKDTPNTHKNWTPRAPQYTPLNHISLIKKPN